MSFWYQSHSHPKYKYVLAFNRDEDILRPYKPTHYWENNPGVLAGLDIPSMGTWLGVNLQTGNVAFLTNCDYLPWKVITGGIEFSRGSLTTRFLNLKSSVLKGEEYESLMYKLLEQKKAFNGYNLVYTNIGIDFSYCINNYWEEDKVLKMDGNIPHALTNGVVSNDLYKANEYQNVLGDILSLPDNTLENTKDRIFQLMSCQKPAPIDKLPVTESSEELKIEHRCSSIFVHKHSKLPDKGERNCATVWTGIVIVTQDNKLHFYERVYDHTKTAESILEVHPVFEKYGIGVKDLATIHYVENHIDRELHP